MGILNLPSELASVVIAAGEDGIITDPDIEYGWYSDLREVDDQLNASISASHDNRQSTRQKRQQKQQTCMKTYKLHEWKRGNGVRQKRRIDHLSSMITLLGDMAIDDAVDDDIFDNGMSVWGKLLDDPCKMKIWNDFMSLTEEKQQDVLSRRHKNNQSNKKVQITKVALKK